MKKSESFLKEYVFKLSDDNLKYLHNLLAQRLSGDLAEAVDFLSGNNDIDRWLALAKNSTEFYDDLDLVTKYTVNEFNRRFN